MDKIRDVRLVGGASRFSPAKRRNTKQTETVPPTKPKKEKRRRLSVSGICSSHEDDDMGSTGSDGEDELLRLTTSVTKRFKLQKKFSINCNRIDNYSSVPRKLRSAIKKRDRESTSPPLPVSKKLNHKIQGHLDESHRLDIMGTITKDEEEVAETLYSLAGMFPVCNDADNNELNGQLLEAKSSPSPLEESSVSSFEDSIISKGEVQICSAAMGVAANYAPPAAKIQSLNEAPDPCDSAMEFNNRVSNVDPSLFSKPEPTRERLPYNSNSFGVPSESNLEPRLKQFKFERTPENAEKPAMPSGPVVARRNQYRSEHNIQESKNTGLGLWPGLCSTGPTVAQRHGTSLQSFSSTLPTWLGNATQPSTSENVVGTRKDSRGAVHVERKNSWKRCSAHVYISRLTKILQISERKERFPQATQFMGDEESHISANVVNLGRNGLNGVVSSNGSTVCYAAEKSPNEVRNAILLHKTLLQDQQQASTSNGSRSNQQQTFDLLSVSAGLKNGLAQFRAPYMKHNNHNLMPFLMPLDRLSSPVFPDHLRGQVQMRLTPYLGGTTFSRSSQKQQLQQQNWNAHLAAHDHNYKTGSPYSQAILLPPMEVIGFKCGPISAQQQQPPVIAINKPTLQPTSERIKWQHRHLPPGYAGNGGGGGGGGGGDGGFYTNGRAPVLKLLCNDRL